MDRVRAVEELVAPILAAMGYGLVRVRLTGDKGQRLQVMAERSDGAPMGVEDCARISHRLLPALDVADPVAGPYELEVSSPGIDRPLVRREDFARFAGFEASVETASLVAGRKRLRGRLAGVEGERLLIDLGGEAGLVGVPLDQVRAAKLVLTDELIAASLKKAEHG